MRIVSSLMVVAVVGLLSVTPAWADLLAYDSITGPDGPIADANQAHQGELNVNPWSQQSGYHYDIVNPGLQYGALVTAGGKVTGGGGYQNAGFTFANLASWNPGDLKNYTKEGPADQRWRIGKEGTTLWASFLIEDWAGNDGNRVRFSDSHIGWNGGAHGIGVNVQGGNWQLQDIASGAYTDTGIARTINETYLMVLKLEFLTGDEYPGDWANGSDRVTLYVNPTPGLAAPDVPGTVMMTSDDLAILNCHFKPGNGSDEGAGDEFRLGETYQDVTPVPEPATIGLLIVGAGLIRRKR